MSQPEPATVNTSVHPVDRPVHTRTEYFKLYRRKQRLKAASPVGKLIRRAKAILEADPRQYGPRLEKVLTRWEFELAAARTKK